VSLTVRSRREVRKRSLRGPAKIHILRYYISHNIEIKNSKFFFYYCTFCFQFYLLHKVKTKVIKIKDKLVITGYISNYRLY